ncbi:hypothetical protein HMPREF1589_02884 [Escherichia coli 113290]|nr:hypothetical protein HMPREF1589_02884 [Escherichia coli 113290]
MWILLQKVQQNPSGKVPSQFTRLIDKKTPAQWQALCSQGITRSDASVALCHIITMRG